MGAKLPKMLKMHKKFEFLKTLQKLQFKIADKSIVPVAALELPV